MAVTAAVVEVVDQVQLDVGGGPVFAALDSRDVVRVVDARVDGRWPGWSGWAAGVGLFSALVVALRAGDRPVGVLSLYSTGPDAFSDTDVATVRVLAGHAAVAVADARHTETLTQAIEAGELVGRASGILMERYQVSSDQAFAILRRYSQHHNTKLRDIAHQLITTRKLPRHPTKH